MTGKGVCVIMTSPLAGTKRHLDLNNTEMRRAPRNKRPTCIRKLKCNSWAGNKLQNKGKCIGNNLKYNSVFESLIWVTCEIRSLTGATWEIRSLAGVTWEIRSLVRVTWEIRSLVGVTWEIRSLAVVTWEIRSLVGVGNLWTCHTLLYSTGHPQSIKLCLKSDQLFHKWLLSRAKRRDKFCLF